MLNYRKNTVHASVLIILLQVYWHDAWYPNTTFGFIMSVNENKYTCTMTVLYSACDVMDYKDRAKYEYKLFTKDQVSVGKNQ